MIKIETIIRPKKLDELKKALSILGVKGMTVTKVDGVGNQRADVGYYRGQKFTIDLVPKVKIEIVVVNEMKDKIIEEIIRVSRTGQVGDGKIFISTINEVYRIRTGETGIDAI